MSPCYPSSLAQLFPEESTFPWQIKSWLKDPKVFTQAPVQLLASDVTVVAYFCNYYYNFWGTKQRNLRICWFCFRKVRLKIMEILQDAHE